MSDPKEEGREEGEVDSVEPDFSKKHPLENRWTLWFDNPNQKQTQKQYGQSLRSVYTFDTVEDFWWWVHGSILYHGFTWYAVLARG
jgi:translation initiation factor 4E